MAGSNAHFHASVASECERIHKVPEVFREVWMRVAAGDELLASAGLETDESYQAEADLLSDNQLRGLGENELHARLRRQIRHSMHVMMQQANPGTYYSEIEHMTPT